MLWRSNEYVVTVRDDLFFVISLTGEVITKLEPRSYSDEDDLWTWRATVEGDRLIQRTTIEGPHRDELYEEKVVATGLQPASDSATLLLVQSALAKADAAAEQARLERERAADARVDAIEGARSDLGAGPVVKRAQGALEERIRSWGDERAGRLLRTLIKLTRAGVSAEVLRAYSRGCLSACFAVDLPPLPGEAKLAPNAELAAELSARAKEVERDGDGQENVDALNNARALWTAAKAIQWAADHLSPGEKP
jgi:hypothetical protein